VKIYIDPRNKILRYPDALARIKRGGRVNPINVEFDLSNACNLRCRWCAFADTHDGAHMPFGLACRIIDQLVSAGVKSLTLTGAGEPTLNPDFARIAHYARRMGLRLGLYTNGLRGQEILDAVGCFDWVYVSLDAATPEAYAEDKGVDGFWRAVETANGLSACDPGPVIGVGFLLNETNWPDASLMAALPLRADYLQFRPAVGLDDYSWVPDALALPVLAQMTSRLYVSCRRFEELWQAQNGTWKRGYAICRASALVPCVGAKGELWVCPNMRGKRKLGELANERFEDIWARRPEQYVGEDCRIACRNEELNRTLEYVCGDGPHKEFV